MISGTFDLFVNTEPDMRFTPGGLAIWEAATAVRPRKSKDGTRGNDALWMSVRAIGDVASNECVAIEKGHRIKVKGYIVSEFYDRKDGSRANRIVLQIQEVLQNDPPSKEGGKPSAKPSAKSAARPRSDHDDHDDHFPF